jgi:hypothetical protein
MSKLYVTLKYVKITWTPIKGRKLPYPLIETKDQTCSTKRMMEQGVMSHSYNPSHLGGRDQEDQGSWIGQAKSLQGSISTNKSWTWWCTSVNPSTRDA